ncbi:MAG: hypothetical protein MJ052_02195 [Sphaerochaetaceae bacterium]|nr:hypothetical protein [Sphaerochaetaceae bacterium]
MKVEELIRKSPVRVFDKSINGGLGKGNLGVLTSPHGVGKTACLVHLALDKLLRGENVVHISFGSNVEHIMNWYKEAFREITDYKSMDDACEVYDRIRANRVMMNFSQENVGVDKILASLETLIKQGSFKADTLFFDGYKMTVASEDDILKIKKFAGEMQVEVWFCVSPVRPDVVYDAYGIANTLEPYRDVIDVLVGLHYNDSKNSVIMTVVKDHKQNIAHPAGVTLDPKTMLMIE